MSAPTNELGHPGGISSSLFPGKQARYTVDPLELNPELAFPNSIPIYDAMRSQETHIGSVLKAVRLPISGARWKLEGDDVKPAVMELVRTELGLNKDGEGRKGRKRRNGVIWRNHLNDALSMLWAGFSAFEQVYEVSTPRADQADLGLDEIVHLRKLAPRLARSITDINVGRDGGLKSIQQMNPDYGALKDTTIPVDRLLFYVHEKEGADWTGRSLLREAYKYWLMKDVYLRLDAQAAERNSMGIPHFSIDDEANRPEADRLGEAYRAGANAHLTTGRGIGFKLEGVSGNTIDLTPKMKYLDQEMSRTALAMFLDLGHDNGARSLGETFYNDVFLTGVQPIADYIAETATEHIIRDLVEHNFGPDETYPVLTAGDLKANRAVGAETMKILADAKIITPDGKLESWVRETSGLPDRDEDTDTGMDAYEQLQRGYYAQGLIRTGFEPADALKTAGLDPVKHLGLLPSTLQTDDDEPDVFTHGRNLTRRLARLDEMRNARS